MVIFADVLLSNFVYSVKKSYFQTLHMYIKCDRNFKDNYRPVIILSHVLSLCHASQCVLLMPEKWKSAVGKGKVFGPLLTDLLKAFDCLSHELLLTTLHAYGFRIWAFRLIHD